MSRATSKGARPIGANERVPSPGLKTGAYMQVDQQTKTVINGVIGRIDRDDSRYYIDPADADNVYDSVTTVLGATTSKDLILVPWAAKLTATYAIDHLDFMAQVVKETSRDGAIDLLKGESRRLREVKADIGSHQHDILEALIIDERIPDVPEHLAGVEIDGEKVDQDAISDGFLNFDADFQPEYEMAEATVANPVLGVGGTLDGVAWLPNVRVPGKATKGARICFDAKTGSHIYDEHRAQIVSYKNMTEVWVDELGNKAAMPEVDICGILHVRPEYKRGYKLYVVPPKDERYYMDWFINCLATYRSQVDAKKRRLTVFYPPLADGSQPAPLIEDVDGWGFGKYRNKLLDAGLLDLADVAAFTVVELCQVKGIGPKAPDVIRETLRQFGLTLKGEVA